MFANKSEGESTLFKKALSAVLGVIIAAMLCVPAFAAGFTPNATDKPAPDIVPITDENGDEYAAVIYDKKENVVAYVPYGNITITPVAEKDNAKHKTIKTNLKNALTQISQAKSPIALCTQLEKAVNEVSDNVDLDNLVVRDLFDVKLNGVYDGYMRAEGNHISIRFDISMSSDQLMSVLHNVGGEKWEAVMGKRLVRSGRTATFALYSPGTVAFLVEGFELPTDPEAPSAPQTNGIYVENYIIIALTVLVFAAGITVITVRKKNSSAN